MKALSLLLATLLANLIPIAAQPPLIQWQNCYGSSAMDIGTSIQTTADGGYILAGYTSGNDGDVTGWHPGTSNRDCWVAKLSSTGALLWSRTLGGSGDETSFAIRQATDGTYWLLGLTTSPTGSGDVSAPSRSGYDFWLVHLDPTGNILNQRRYGGITNYQNGNFRLTPDGGMILAASAWGNGGDVTGNHGLMDGWVVKLDKNGAIQWQTSVGGSGNDAMADVEVLPDGTYIAVGLSSSADIPGSHYSSDDFFAVRLDNAGRILWQKCYGGSSMDEAYGIAPASDGGVVVTGLVDSRDGDVAGNHGGADCWVLALDVNGAIKWQHCYGGSGTEYAASITATPDKGYLVTGSTMSGDGDLPCPVTAQRGWVLKIDAAGAPLWNKSLGNPDAGSSLMTFILAAGNTADGGTVVVGEANSPSLPRMHKSAGPTNLDDVYVVRLLPTSSSLPTATLAAPGQACQGSPLTLSVSSAASFTSYAWYRNSVDQGVNAASYTASNFHDGDQVMVKAFYAIDDCHTNAVMSNAVTLTVKSSITPSVQIIASPASACEGTPVDFSASVTDGGPGPVYQWLVNGRPQGANSPAFQSSSLADKDQVSCMVTGNTCTLPAQSTSNTIAMTVIPNRATALDIRSTPLPACAGQSVEFEADASGSSASYQWSLNGRPVGGNSPSYTNSGLADGDVVSCTASYSSGCQLPATANATAAIEAYPVIKPVPPLVLPKGQSVNLAIPVSGPVTSYAWSPAAGLSDPTAAMPVASPSQTTRYTLIAATQAGCADTADIVVEVQSPLGIPNAFSPNGDGKNDVFYITGGPFGCRIKELGIFDRWGTMVFQVHDAPTGDAAYGWNGNAAPTGAYVYFARLSIPGSKDQVYRGTLMLVR